MQDDIIDALACELGKTLSSWELKTKYFEFDFLFDGECEILEIRFY